MKPKHTDYNPGTMSFSAGFCGSKGDVGYFMEADWEMAKEIVNSLNKDEIQNVEMGLDGDWIENSMIIWENGEFEEYYLHHGSQWAEPLLIVNYKNGRNEAYSCWHKVSHEDLK